MCLLTPPFVTNLELVKPSAFPSNTLKKKRPTRCGLLCHRVRAVQLKRHDKSARCSPDGVQGRGENESSRDCADGEGAGDWEEKGRRVAEEKEQVVEMAHEKAVVV